MIILLFFICLCFLITGIVMMKNYRTEESGFIITILSALTMVVVITCGLLNIHEIVKSNVLDEKIVLYETENVEIENQINSLIEEYMNYEKEMYTELKGNDGISLVSLYPNLKSDELIKTQIEVYNSNKKEIKFLKSKLLDVKTNKWWLYFGK